MHPRIDRSPAATEAQAQPWAHAGVGAPRRQAVLLTGAGGEVGHGLIHRLSESRREPIVAMDLRPLDDDLARRCQEVFVGDVRDPFALSAVLARYEVVEVYHLAALLSSAGERNPELAHEVNTQGTMNPPAPVRPAGPGHRPARCGSSTQAPSPSTACPARPRSAVPAPSPRTSTSTPSRCTA
ncbi:MAG: hypothetical protein KatS3mg103_0368 [Phycisphaerales bacterium]|nr:MAG: hypothetical protein KatS3mg103_0368 [Phycisphaerales bacterium]